MKDWSGNVNSIAGELQFICILAALLLCLLLLLGYAIHGLLSQNKDLLELSKLNHDVLLDAKAIDKAQDAAQAADARVYINESKVRAREQEKLFDKDLKAYNPARDSKQQPSASNGTGEVWIQDEAGEKYKVLT